MESRVGFWPRLGAHVIDGVLTFMLAVVLSGVVAPLFPAAVAAHVAELTAKAGETPGTATMYPLMARFAVAVVFVSPFYAIIEGLLGASPGKLALGLRITDLRGVRASLPRLLGRCALKTSGTLLAWAALLTGIKSIEPAAQALSFIMGVGCFFALGAARQALHDKLVHTAVLRKSDLVAAGG